MSTIGDIVEDLQVKRSGLLGEAERIGRAIEALRGEGEREKLEGRSEKGKPEELEKDLKDGKDQKDLRADGGIGAIRAAGWKTAKHGKPGGRRCAKCGEWKGNTGFPRGGGAICRKCAGLPTGFGGRKKEGSENEARRVCALCATPRPLSEFPENGMICRKCGKSN